MGSLTYDSKMTLSRARIVVSGLKPEEVHPDDLMYLQQLYDQLYNFFKNRLDAWQFDVWRSRYVD